MTTNELHFLRDLRNLLKFHGVVLIEVLDLGGYVFDGDDIFLAVDESLLDELHSRNGGADEP